MDWTDRKGRADSGALRPGDLKPDESPGYRGRIRDGDFNGLSETVVGEDALGKLGRGPRLEVVEGCRRLHGNGRNRLAGLPFVSDNDGRSGPFGAEGACGVDFLRIGHE